MTLEKCIEELTSMTANGGFFRIGGDHVRVWYGMDWWEWEYRDNSFYDVKDLAEAVLGRHHVDSRLVRFYTGSLQDQRRSARA